MRYLIPLLRAMGYREVEHYHGPRELGKDIVAWKKGNDETRENIAIVAKGGKKISAKASGELGTIVTQINQAYDSQFSDMLTGEVQRIHRVYIATPADIRPNVREAILESVGRATPHRFIIFWHGTVLLDLLDKYLTDLSLPDELAGISKRLNELKHFSIEPKFSNSNIYYNIQPKTSDTILAKGTFIFPDTKRGREMQSAIDKFFEEGESFTIPGEFIQSFDHHDELVRIFGNEKPEYIKIGPSIPSEPYGIILEINTIDGPVIYDGLMIQAIKSGTRKQVFKTNDNDPLLISINVEKMPDDTYRAQTSFRFQLTGFKSSRIRQATKIWGLFSNGFEFSIKDKISGNNILPSASFKDASSPDRNFIEYLDNIGFIENKLGWITEIPEDASLIELSNAKKLRLILENGMYIEPFDEFNGQIDQENARLLINVLEINKQGSIGLTATSTRHSLLGYSLNTGPSLTLLDPIISSKDNYENMIKQLDAGSENIDAVFTPSDKCHGAQVFFPDFLKGEYLDRYNKIIENHPDKLNMNFNKSDVI